VNGIKKGFNNDISSKRKAWEKLGRDRTGNLVTEDTEKAKVFHVFLLSEFTHNLQELQAQ